MHKCVKLISRFLADMFLRIEFVPEFLAEVLRLATDTFQIVEVSGRYLLKDGAKMRHRHRREAVMGA